MERYSPLAGGPVMLFPEPDADTAAAGEGRKKGVNSVSEVKMFVDIRWMKVTLLS